MYQQLNTDTGSDILYEYDLRNHVVLIKYNKR